MTNFSKCRQSSCHKSIIIIRNTVTYLPRGPAVVHGAPPRHDLHYKNAKAIDVAPLIQHPGACILRSHVPAKRRAKVNSHQFHSLIKAKDYRAKTNSPKRSHNSGSDVTLLRANELCQSKIRHLGVPLPIQQDVARLYVAMHNLRLETLVQISQPN